ncbi:HlyD family efflux transporter periplasmic adaptor subunit [Pseudomonas parafulva]|uniref:HlyD family efflux transporter periplasmic adaptor subunit n=1 Tax=Pseudomonas parafulva TaxID=157782 RepID=A0AAI8KES3_9PSED|nr:HlyD family efflux transporter periplasmic adaptor subunit [Pseudomonas parafulva]AIZ34137.1 multidrug transporter [Pseudomonas parafulva]AXO89853.1 HlyD family efflux transporter periplasmic adaptor subunit [Pseudomonas parafulva]
MNAPVPGALEQLLAQYLKLERQARSAPSVQELAFSMVNDSQALFGYRHGALLITGKVRALTGVSAVEPNAPFVVFIERAAKVLAASQRFALPGVVPPQDLDQACRDDWQALSAPHAFWLPLKDRQGEVFGGLWLARDMPWNDAEQALLAQLGDCYSHAWRALQPGKPWRLRWPARTRWALAAALLLVLLVPVRQSVLAPAEVAPRNGQVIAAPLDGVVAEVLVKPNQSVKAGEVLVRFDATTLKAQADVAQRTLGVAEAELKANTQRAFSDADSSARLDLLAARVEQKRAERDYARNLLARSEVRAERDGIAVFADAQRFVGKPMRTGERLMEIADPAQAELRIELPVADAIGLERGAEVALFLDSDPLNRHNAVLERAAYQAQNTPAGQLAYRLDARFENAPPRIGLRGTAKVFGDRAPLALYLLRRPLAALRQAVGL